MNNVLAIVGGVVGLVTFLGVVATYLRGSADKGTISSLESSVRALEGENKIKDEKIARLERDRQAADAKVEQLTTEVGTLRGVVTQEKAIVKLQTTLDQFRVENMAVLHLIEQGLRNDQSRS